MKAQNNYLKLVEWSDEDQCYIGTCPGFFGGGVHGDDECKVYNELCQVVDEWIDIYKQDGKPLPPATVNKDYSGKFNLRVGEDLHKILSISALKAGISLNAYCLQQLKR